MTDANYWRAVEVVSKRGTGQAIPVDRYIVLEQHTGTGEYRRNVLSVDDVEMV